MEMAAFSVDSGVYPRVGGETRSSSVYVAPASGLSPRGRGNHGIILTVHLNAGSIPAWAGKPRMCARVHDTT